MGKAGSLDRLDRQRFTPVAPQAGVWAVAPGQDSAWTGRTQCLVQEDGQPAQPHCSKPGFGGGKHWRSMKLQGTGH